MVLAENFGPNKIFTESFTSLPKDFRVQPTQVLPGGNFVCSVYDTTSRKQMPEDDWHGFERGKL